MSNEMNTQEEKKVLTQKDLNKAMFRWYMSAEMPLNFENMQGIAFCGSISHILKKLYTKKEDLSEALKRHLLLYNCNVTAGGLILGTTIAMEEQRAKDPSKMPDMAITGLKTGLMGPVAALGVPLWSLVLKCPNKRFPSLIYIRVSQLTSCLFVHKNSFLLCCIEDMEVLYAQE